MSEGLLGSRDPDVIHDLKYRQAQQIIDDEYGDTTDLPSLPWQGIQASPIEVAATFFDGMVGDPRNCPVSAKRRKLISVANAREFR